MSVRFDAQSGKYYVSLSCGSGVAYFAHADSAEAFVRRFPGALLRESRPTEEPDSNPGLAFLKDLAQLQKEHGLCLSPEDDQGGFLVVPHNVTTITWQAHAKPSDRGY